MITEDHLRLRLNAPRAQRDAWLSRQLLLATFAHRGLLKRVSARRGETPAPIPDAQEIVDETILRILSHHNAGYEWDGMEPNSFDAFFARCLKRTANYFWADIRGDFTGTRKFKHLVVEYTPFELTNNPHRDLDRKREHAALAAAIAKTRIRGVTLAYVNNLQHYVDVGLSTAEIAKDLSVKPGTVASVRHRLNKFDIFDDTDNK